MSKILITTLFCLIFSSTHAATINGGTLCDNASTTNTTTVFKNIMGGINGTDYADGYEIEGGYLKIMTHVFGYPSTPTISFTINGTKMISFTTFAHILCYTSRLRSGTGALKYDADEYYAGRSHLWWIPLTQLRSGANSLVITYNGYTKSFTINY